MGSITQPSPYLSFFCTSERHLSMRYFLCLFLGTGDGEQCWEEHSASGALHTEAKVLSAESEHLGSEAGQRVASIRILLSLISLSFLVWDLKS